MTDLDPEIWNNPTLGSVGSGPFLPEVEAQEKENYNARKEGREPKTVVYTENYPKYIPSGSVPSHVETLEFIEPGAIANDNTSPEESDSVDSSSDGESNPVVPNAGDNTLPAFE